MMWAFTFACLFTLQLQASWFEQKVKEIASEWHHCEPEEINLITLPHGFSAQKVCLMSSPGEESTIIKGFKSANNLQDESRALEILQSLNLTKIQAVKPLNLYQDQWIFLLEESRAPGESIAEKIRCHTLNPSMNTQIAQGLADLHSQTIADNVSQKFLEEDWNETQTVYTKLKKKGLGESWHEVVNLIWYRVQSTPGVATYVHGDAHPENIFICEEMVTLIDVATLMRSEKGGSAARDFYYFRDHADEMMFYAGWSKGERDAYKEQFSRHYELVLDQKMPSQEAMDFYYLQTNLGILFKSAMRAKKESKCQILLDEKLQEMNSFINNFKLVNYEHAS